MLSYITNNNNNNLVIAILLYLNSAEYGAIYICIVLYS